jgi:penicillin-binding protein 1C
MSSSQTEKGPRIVSPKDGLTYHVRVNPNDEEVINLEAISEAPHEHLRWFVDTAYLGLSEASTSLLWKPLPGRHVIRAVDDSGRVDSRLITVTAVE